MRARVLLLLALALAARPAAASSALELARSAARAAEERDRLRTERLRLSGEAATAALGIRGLDAPDGAARAGRELSRRLREFEGIATRLDEVERALADKERRLARARSDFLAAAEAEERALEQRAAREGPAAVSSALDALAAARRAVGALDTASGFRPPLDVAVDASDGPAEIDTKLALIDAERARVAARLAALQGEETLLATRASAKREYARELAAARRDAAGSVELLDRSYEQVQAAMRELAARAEALARERSTLETADRGLATRRAEAERRRQSLTKGHETR